MKKVFAVMAIVMASSTVFAADVSCTAALDKLIVEARQTALIESQLLTVSNAKVEEVVKAIDAKNAKLEESKVQFILNGCLN